MMRAGTLVYVATGIRKEVIKCVFVVHAAGCVLVVVVGLLWAHAAVVVLRVLSALVSG